MTKMLTALEASFSDLPDQVSQQAHKAGNSFKDPKTFISAGISDIIGFLVLGDDFVSFAQQIAVDYLAMANTMLQQIISVSGGPGADRAVQRGQSHGVQILTKVARGRVALEKVNQS